MSYTGEFGEIVVYEWIDKAAAKCPWSDIAIERYISGIRRLRLIEEVFYAILACLRMILTE